MRTQSRRALLTLAFAFVIGGFVGSVVAMLLVPARLPVEYLTPITASGHLVGLLVGGAVARFGTAARQPAP